MRALQHFITNLGIQHAPLNERESLRRVNKRIAGDILMGSSLIPVYMILGAWHLVILSLLLSLVGPMALVLNAYGYFRAARLLVSISFGVSIAFINVMVGTWCDSEVFLCAGIASVYANFKENERIEKAGALILIVTLTISSHFWSVYHTAYIDIPEHWQVYINGAVWFFGGVFMMTQISILVETLRFQQKEIRASEELYSEIFSLAGTGLNVLTSDGYYLKSNPEMCRLTGYTEQELHSLRSVDITAPEDQNNTLAEYQQFLEGKIPFVIREKVYLHKDGHRVPARLQSRAIRDDAGGIKFFVTSVQDLTEAKAADQKLIENSKMSSLGEMAGSIAHEINTPLAIIQITAEQLETPEIIEQLTKDEISSMAKTIGTTVMRVASIVKGLKAFARNADQDPFEKLSVKEVVADSLTLCREKFKNEQITLSVEIPDDLDILCRSTQISQVLVNLLNNSVDAISQNRDRWVRVEASGLGSEVVLRVTDSGRGVPEAIASRILEPFFTTKAFGKGTGLGLSVSKGIIESHGGRFYLDRDSRQTSFVIEIPRAPVRAA